MSGKDYPTFSLSSLGKKGNFKVRSLAHNFYNNLSHQGIKPAPADKIPKDYPKNSISGGGGSSHKKSSSGGGGVDESRRGGGHNNGFGHMLHAGLQIFPM